MKLTVSHKTVYRFDPPKRGVVQSLRLYPSQFEGQVALDWLVEVEGGTRGTSFRDSAGDLVETVSIMGMVSEISIDVHGTVETSDLSGVLRGHREAVPVEAYLRDTALTRADLAIEALAAEAASAEGESTLGVAHNLMKAVGSGVAYRTGSTSSATTAAESLAAGEGVCQDHAHLMISAARSLEIPARYVSGYLFSGVGDARAEASHAWAELWVDGLGWVGFDASNNTCPDERYIRLGSGFDAIDGAPIRGISRGHGVESLEVVVDVAAAQQ